VNFNNIFNNKYFGLRGRTILFSAGSFRFMRKCVEWAYFYRFRKWGS